MSRWRLPALLVALAVAAATSVSAPAATPSGGTISSSSPSVTWTGHLAVNSGYLVGTATCAPVPTPGCDHFALTVDAPDGTWVSVVAVVADRTSEFTRISHDVVDGDGEVVGRGLDDGSSTLPALFRHRSGAGPYTVRVTNEIGTGGVDYEAEARLSAGPVDHEAHCPTEYVPDRLDPAGAAGLGTSRSLAIHVLLDELPESYGRQVAPGIAQVYGDAGVTATFAYQEVDFGTGSTADSEQMIAQARDLVGGSVPAGSDVVYAMTWRNLTSGPLGGAVAGQANCVGGAHSPFTAFAVGEAYGEHPNQLADSAIVAAHEIGHLLGAHHHYATCGQGLFTASGNRSSHVCTLMAPELSLTSLVFSPTSKAVVRGHLDG